MYFVEFLVFLPRIAHEVYIGTDYAEKRLHRKVDKILQKILDSVGVDPHYRYMDSDSSGE